MPSQLSVSIDADVYNGLLERFGEARISQFLSDLARPYADRKAMAQGYRDLANDADAEREANEWIEGVVGDLADEEG